MTQLDTFTEAYITTALWSSNDDDGTPLDMDFGRLDIAPETLARMVADCERFQQENAATLQAAIDTGEVVCGLDRAGHDVWLTRNRHGAGFWDGDWPEPMAQALTDAAHAFGEVDLYVGDDGKVWS
jgi:hypothetical protein